MASTQSLKLIQLFIAAWIYYIPTIFGIQNVVYNICRESLLTVNTRTFKFYFLRFSVQVALKKFRGIFVLSPS